MANPFDTFEKKHDYLVCIDSDGCAMDTMDIKHIRCFGPCMVDEWQLDAWRQPILDRWNVINLYSMTRGINRFKALAVALKEINEQYTRIDGVDVLVEWAENAKELSNGAIEKLLQEKDCPVMAKALAWSKAVNASINLLPEEEKVPFKGVNAGIAAAHEVADIAIVSSANLDAVLEEWEKHHLLEHTDIVCSQNAGSKSFCIAELLKKGYANDHVLILQPQGQNVQLRSLIFRGKFHTGNGFHGAFPAGFQKFRQPRHGIVVGQRHGGKTQLFRRSHQLRRRKGAVGKDRMCMQVAVSGHRHVPFKFQCGQCPQTFRDFRPAELVTPLGLPGSIPVCHFKFQFSVLF